MNVEKFNQEIGELKNALEYQIDVVLRLEEERLLVHKENKIQKEKNKELQAMLEKYIGFHQLMQIEKAVQTDSMKYLNKEVQAECDDDRLSQSCTSMSLSQTENSASKPPSSLNIEDLQHCIEQELVSEAKSLLTNTKRSTAPTPKQLSQKLPQRNLKFCGDSYKENKTPQQPQKKQAIKPEQEFKDLKDTQLESLAKELLRITKETQQLKLTQRALQDTIKKHEKDNHELQKQVEVKNTMLDKLREEVAEMSIIINESKFKSMRVLDSEHKKISENCKTLQKQLDQKTLENQQQAKDLNQFRSVLEKMTEQYERLRNKYQIDPMPSEQAQVNSSRTEELQLSSKVHYLQEELKIRDLSLQEFKNVNEKLVQEVDYFRQISLRQKERHDQQEQDLELYRGLLIKHNIIK